MYSQVLWMDGQVSVCLWKWCFSSATYFYTSGVVETLVYSMTAAENTYSVLTISLCKVRVENSWETLCLCKELYILTETETRQLFCRMFVTLKKLKSSILLKIE